MKKFRMRDVPKGKRWNYFWSYYAFHVFWAVIFSVFTGYTVYLLCFKPHTDVSLMWLSDRYDLVCEGLLNKEMQREFPDINGDGTVKVTLSHILFDREYEKLPQETKAELSILLSVGDTYILFASDTAAEWLREMNLLGTWGDFGGCEGKPDKDIFLVKISQVEFFRKDGYNALKEANLCIVRPPVGERKNYDIQMNVLRKLLQY